MMKFTENRVVSQQFDSLRQTLNIVLAQAKAVNQQIAVMKGQCATVENELHQVQTSNTLFEIILQMHIGLNPNVGRTKQSLSNLKLAVLVDDLTATALARECHILQLKPDIWQQQLAEFQPDLLLVKPSCRRNVDSWSDIISRCTPALVALSYYCKAHELPTAFWNNEDPDHYDAFLAAASLFDTVFTNDIKKIAFYKTDLKHDRVYLTSCFQKKAFDINGHSIEALKEVLLTLDVEALKSLFAPTSNFQGAGKVDHLISEVPALKSSNSVWNSALLMTSKLSFNERLSIEFSRLFALMQKTTKSKLSAIENERLKHSGKASGVNIINANFQTASDLFYKEGNIFESLAIVENLERKNILTKAQRNFYVIAKGLVQVLENLKIPPRMQFLNKISRKGHVLYCLHQSLPHTTNGYATRSHGVALGLLQNDLQVTATTRVGFPWDSHANFSNKSYIVTDIEGVIYTSSAGSSLGKVALDQYIFETADHFMREALKAGAELIIAASNHITALPALIAARRLGLPFVYEVRGLWEVTQASIQPEWFKSDRYHFMRTMETIAAREADLVITLTKELTTELELRGVEPNRIKIVPNAVDVERFCPVQVDQIIKKKLNLQPGIPVIGYAGSVVAYEGLDLLVEALAELKSSLIPFYFVLVGDGLSLSRIKTKIKKLGLENDCRIVGRVPFDDIPSYLSCMDIMPVPRISSAVTEMVSALKPLEAMAMAKALVLSDVAPHHAFAGNNERALLFKKDNVTSLAAALERLITDPVLCNRLGAAAREWIEINRTWKRVTEDYTGYLQQVLTHGVKAAPNHSQQNYLAEITFAVVGSDFITASLANIVQVINITPANWHSELKDKRVDVLFFEIPAMGGQPAQENEHHYSHASEVKPFVNLIAKCQEEGVPRLYWGLNSTLFH